MLLLLGVVCLFTVRSVDEAEQLDEDDGVFLPSYPFLLHGSYPGEHEPPWVHPLRVGYQKRKVDYKARHANEEHHVDLLPEGFGATDVVYLRHLKAWRFDFK